MKKDDYFSEDEMANILRIKKSTLIKNRCLGTKHPPYIKLGRIILYPRKEAADWMDAIPINREIINHAS